MGMVLSGKPSLRTRLLMPVVTYETLEFPVDLDNVTQIKLSIEQDEGSPVISLDPDGTVHALQVGRAVLVGDFVGAIDRLQVLVEPR
jgi:hypothetical protein